MTAIDALAGGGTEPVPIDVDALGEEVRRKYRDVARDPDGEHHFHTGRRLARLLGYPDPDTTPSRRRVTIGVTGSRT